MTKHGKKSGMHSQMSTCFLKVHLILRQRVLSPLWWMVIIRYQFGITLLYLLSRQTAQMDTQFLFNRLISGEVSFLYQQINNITIVWHKSPRQNVLIQESHLIIKEDKIVPLYHRNIRNPKEIHFVKDKPVFVKTF